MSLFWGFEPGNPSNMLMTSLNTCISSSNYSLKNFSNGCAGSSKPNEPENIAKTYIYNLKNVKQKIIPAKHTTHTHLYILAVPESVAVPH